MKNKLVTLFLAVVVIASLVLAGCAKPAPAPGPTPAPGPAPAPTGPKEIRVGFPLPLTGDLAGFGEGLLFGARAAVEDINNQGGVYVKEFDRKLPVKLIALDEEGDPAKTATLTDRLVTQDKVHILTTPDCPDFLQTPVSIVAERNKVPNVIGGGPWEAWSTARMVITPPWEYSWCTGFGIANSALSENDFFYGEPGYTLQDVSLGTMYLHGDETNKKVGIFAPGDFGGLAWYALFPKLVQKRGYTPVGIDDQVGLHPRGTLDFSSMITKWQKNNVEILLGEMGAVDFGTMWRQAQMMGFKPKMVLVSEAGLFYTDIMAWGGDLPNGVCTETWWGPTLNCPGIGDTTPQSLTQRWVEATNEPLNPGIGHGYHPMQIIFDAVERAGTLDSSEVNKALSETDMMTISGRMVFNPETQVSLQPLAITQWQKTDKPEIWEKEIIYSNHDFLPKTAEMIFPVSYE